MELQGSCLAEKQVQSSSTLNNATFQNDVNFRQGMIYDWDMQPLEMVDFKFEKINTFTFEKKAVEYMIQFRPDYCPEYKFRNEHFRKDGRERLGFYIDVYDHSKGQYDKWMLVGKDERSLFPRYNALKCNWFFEWVENGKYRRSLGIIRDAAENSFNNTYNDPIGGTKVSATLTFLLPYNEDTTKINLGKTFICSDTLENPQVFKINRIKDNTVPGVIRYDTKEDLFNRHTDYVGEVNGQDFPFTFETPIPDLPEGFGGKVHMMCGALYDAARAEEVEPFDFSADIEITTQAKDIYVNGSPAIIESNVPVSSWTITVDGRPYNIEDLDEYFEIVNDDKYFTIKAINKQMVKYVVAILARDMRGNVSEEVRLVVKQ